MRHFWVICIAIVLVGCSRYEGTDLQGYIEGQYTHMSPFLGGRLKKLYVSRGQSVRQGQPLFELDNEPEQSQLNKALASLQAEQAKLKDYLVGQRTTVLAGIIAQREQAQAELGLAKNNFARTEELFQKGVVSRSSYDDACAKLKSTQQRVNQYEENLKEAEQGERQYRVLEQANAVKSAEASVTEARWRLFQKKLFAPESGLIYDTFYNVGEQINAGQPVVSLLTPDCIYLIFYVPEPLRSKVAVNDRVEFDCDQCQEQFSATINYVSPQAEYTPPVIYSRESRSKLVYRIQAKLSRPVAQKIYPGQPVNVYLLKKKSAQRSYLGNLWQQWMKM